MSNLYNLRIACNGGSVINITIDEKDKAKTALELYSRLGKPEAIKFTTPHSEYDEEIIAAVWCHQIIGFNIEKITMTEIEQANFEHLKIATKWYIQQTLGKEKEDWWREGNNGS